MTGKSQAPVPGRLAIRPRACSSKCLNDFRGGCRARPLVADQIGTMVSSCQGSPVDLFRTPPHRSTTFSVVVHATGATQLVSPREILSERISHGIKARVHMSLNMEAL